MQHQAGQPPSYTNYRPKCPQKHQPFGVFCIRQKDDIPPGQVAINLCAPCLSLLQSRERLFEAFPHLYRCPNQGSGARGEMS